MYFADQSGVLVLIRLLLGRGEYGQHHLLGILPDIKHWCLSFSVYWMKFKINTLHQAMSSTKRREPHSPQHTIVSLTLQNLTAT